MRVQIDYPGRLAAVKGSLFYFSISFGARDSLNGKLRGIPLEQWIFGGGGQFRMVVSLLVFRYCAEVPSDL